MASSILIAFVFGVSLHLSIFRYGEWDLYTVRIIACFLLSTLALYYTSQTEIIAQISPQESGLTRTASLLVSTIVGLYASLLVYRGFFHRLNHFPGPILARFSNFYITTLSAKNLRLYEEVQELHKIYGDVVRLGKITPFASL